MSRERKPIPAPTSLSTPQQIIQSQLDEAYKIPFVLCEGPRMMLNFLASNSGLPDAYRNMIAQWLLVYNDQLVAYVSKTYGGDKAVAEIDYIAKGMFQGFIQAIRDEREQADTEMFEGLDREIFGGDDFPEPE